MQRPQITSSRINYLRNHYKKNYEEFQSFIFVALLPLVGGFKSSECVKTDLNIIKMIKMNDVNDVNAHLLQCHHPPGRAPPPALWPLSLRDLGWQLLSEGPLWSLQLQGTTTPQNQGFGGEKTPWLCFCLFSFFFFLQQLNFISFLQLLPGFGAPSNSNLAQDAQTSSRNSKMGYLFGFLGG